MEVLKTENLDKAFKSLAIISLIIAALILTKDIVLPITFAVLFSVVLLPVVKRVEKKTGRIFSIIIVLAGSLLLFVLFTWFIVSQLTSLVASLPDIEDKFFSYVNEVSSSLSNQFKISTEDQGQLLKEGIKNLSDNAASLLLSTSYLVYFFIQLPIYVFLFLLYFGSNFLPL